MTKLVISTAVLLLVSLSVGYCDSCKGPASPFAQTAVNTAR
jgi:hypothetical protein